ncbi:MAG: hypothetical protein H7Z72_11715 [Bacteroidetes bacterium]|nr:hypothetical protein [Fibrella sp.]
MAYSDFNLDKLEERFGVKSRYQRLFDDVIPIVGSDWLKQSLHRASELPLRSEKARSEWIVAPILNELRTLNDKYFTIYSGENLNADELNGLNGECDFILAKDIRSVNINYPIVQVVEAKKNDLDIGIPQCAAQLIGARLFNHKKGVDLDRVYGCVTTGTDWIFLMLADHLFVDTRLYYLDDVAEIMGVFQSIIDYYKRTLS